MQITLAEAQLKLPQLIKGLAANEDLVLYDNGEPVAKVVRLVKKAWPCQPGTAKDLPHWMAPDFNAPLEDFAEYMA